MRTLFIALFSLALVVGCSDDDVTPTADQKVTTPDMSTQMDGKTQMDGSGGTGVTLTGSFLTFGTTSVVKDVKVCVKDSTTLCATSDATGAFTLKDVPDKDTLISMMKTGYFPFYGMYGKGQTTKAYDKTSLLTPVLVTTMVTAVGATTDATKGHIVLTAEAGTAFTMKTPDGKGPFYLSALGLPDATLKETSAAKRAFILNVTPGDYEITFKNSKGLTCTVQMGWAGATADAVKIQVVKGAGTFATMTCK